VESKECLQHEDCKKIGACSRDDLRLWHIQGGIGANTSTGKEGRAEEIQAEKDDLLKKQKEGKGHWKDELASDSESIVR
jgi:hypothetical protein